MGAEKLTHAIQAAKLGLAVLPVHSIKDGRCTCGIVDCASPGKHPVADLVPNGVKQASKDPEQILEWWMQREDANIGIATGAVSNLYVLDVDPRHGGIDSLAKLEQENGALPATWVVDTGGGGSHYLF